MHARELAWPSTPVHPHVTLREAAELLVRERSPALVVVSEDGHPLAVVPAADVLTATLPDPVREDPLLAASAKASLDDAVRARAAHLRLTDVLPKHLPAPAVVSPAASPLHMASLMERTGSHLVVVVDYRDERPELLGTVDAATLLQHYL
ncbi:CBS domain-containing protein [Streptomyces sp. NBC_00691]|uniref:CBS domain-containing protein n=1 Tax=Streptomyces sp. NBC_00691 TaxID=2903671 RepID=UPI002E2FF26C|nr:CBS domain-containing protein [Streptomyces sp. NBC_00691]